MDCRLLQHTPGLFIDHITNIYVNFLLLPCCVQACLGVCTCAALCVCVCVCVCMCAELLLLVSAILGFPYISDPCIFHYLLMILIIVFSALTVDCYVSCLFTVIVKVFPVNFFFYPCKIKFSRSSSLFFSPSHTHTHK